MGVCPTKALQQGLGSALVWVFVVPRPCNRALPRPYAMQWMLALPRPRVVVRGGGGGVDAKGKGGGGLWVSMECRGGAIKAE